VRLHVPGGLLVQGLIRYRPDLAGATINKVLPKPRCRRMCRKPPKPIALMDFSNAPKGLYDQNKPWVLVLLDGPGTRWGRTTSPLTG